MIPSLHPLPLLSLPLWPQTDGRDVLPPYLSIYVRVKPWSGSR